MKKSETLLNEEIKIREKYGSVVIPLHLCRHYGDLRAKEAVKEFAEELIRVFNEPHYVPFSAAAVIKHLAKQKGVEI